MNTKTLMTVSAALMGVAGILLTFLSDEVVTFYGYESTILNVLPIQISGTLYFAFGMLNWMARGSMIGGIYSKPVSMGNFAHFFIGALTIVKAAFLHSGIFVLWMAGFIYSLFAILFGVVSFGNPFKKGGLFKPNTSS